MVFKPSILGIMYNNILGKLFLVACIVFLTLKHTIAGLLGVVFIAVIASNSVFEGVENKENEKENEKEKEKTQDPAAVVKTEEPMENESSSKNVNFAGLEAAVQTLTQ